MNNILIVEDDRALSNGIVLALKNTDYSFIQAFTIYDAKVQLASQEFNLVILDVNLPDGNGLDLLKEIRESLKIPIIMLTANDMETDIVLGLELGADDYITKPFSLMVLRARVNTQLKRIDSLTTAEIKIDDFIFNFESMEFKKKNESIELSKTEQRLLRFLIQNKGITLKRSYLVDKIWTDSSEYVDENALSVTIKRLRDKLEKNPSKPNYIKTVYGVGYSWVVR